LCGGFSNQPRQLVADRHLGALLLLDEQLLADTPKIRWTMRSAACKRAQTAPRRRSEPHTAFAGVGGYQVVVAVAEPVEPTGRHDEAGSSSSASRLTGSGA
jgi:hypothetical protein